MFGRAFGESPSSPLSVATATVPAMRRSVVWVKPEGAELADVEISGGTLRATGAAIGADPLPYRLEYELTTGDGYVTEVLSVRTEGRDQAAGHRWHRSLELSRKPSGGWTARSQSEGDLALPPPGGDLREFRGALDCDLGLSPLTNSMPVLRHGLLDGGGPIEFLMAWVSVPDLSVQASTQTYEFVRRDGDRAVIRFSSGTFTNDITFDADGLVVDYPAIGRRIEM
jgi:hypothetical protein